MRDDMAKQLVKTHRNGGHSDGAHAKRQRDRAAKLEDLPTKETIRPYYYDRKGFGENFAPLLGFLRKNVGRPWNKVNGELTKAFHGGGTIVQHAKMHLKGFVETSPMWDGNVPCHKEFRGDGEPLPLAAGQMYVDRHGLLAVVKKKAKKVLAESVVYVHKSKHEYLKIKGLWFEIYCQPLPKAEVGVTAWDAVVGRLFTTTYHSESEWLARDDKEKYWQQYCHKPGRRYEPRVRYAVKKRQLNSREIRRVELP